MRALMHTKKASSAGFTLVELLLVLAILGFALAAVHRSFAQGLRCHKRFAEMSRYAASCSDLWQSIRTDALTLTAADSVRIDDTGSIVFCREGHSRPEVLYRRDPHTQHLVRLEVQPTAHDQADTLLTDRFQGISTLTVESHGTASGHRKAHLMSALPAGDTPGASPQSLRIWLPVRSALAEADL